MISSPLTFKGLLSKNIISDDTLKRFLVKIQDLRKISQIVVEYLFLIHKSMEIYHSSIVRQCQLLESQMSSEINDDKRYYLQFTMIFQAISINIQHFNCTLESNLKEYHVSTCMQLDELTTSHLDPLMNSYKKYKSAEESLHESSKKWLKSEKQLSESIKSYNDSFVDPRLIYNKNQVNKRYLNCESSYHNTVKQEVNIKEKTDKLLKLKVGCMNSHNKFLSECKKSYEFIHERIILEAKSTLALFCTVHKMLVSDIANKKKGFEEAKIKPFLYTLPEVQNQYHFFDISETGSKDTGKYPIFLQKCEKIKNIHLRLFFKWLSEYGQFLKDSGQYSRKLTKKVFSFLSEIIKSIEKMCYFMTKQVPAVYEKIKKKMVQMFGITTLDFVKSVNTALESTIRIYEKLVKVSYQKLQNMTQIMNDNQKMSDMFFKEYNKQLELYTQQTKTPLMTEDYKQIRTVIEQKSEIIKYCITSFGEKISKNNEAFKADVKSIIHQIFSSVNEIFIYSSEYQQTFFGTQFVENLKKIKNSIVAQASLDGIISQEAINQIIEVQEIQRFDYSQFQKIKRNDVEPEKQTKQRQKSDSVEASPVQPEKDEERVTSLSGGKKQLSEIDIKQKKNYDFLSQKITFEQGQQFRRTFSCALYDKILLQGKLFVTDRRLCFHSYFNTSNLFFGGTFLVIPKKDILKAEKRYNAKIFDNSVSITTVNGQVFFTSFFSRDEAFSQILDAFGLKCEEEVKENQDKADQNQNTKQQNVQSNQIDVEQQQVIEPLPDDLSQEQVMQRSQKLQQVLNKKMEKIGSGVIRHVNCLYVLKNFLNSQQYILNEKKYSGFYEYLKQYSGEKQITLEPWEPNIQLYLNKNNIKKDTPFRFNRKCKFTHTLPKSGIPFMPKTCKTEESHRLSIVSADRFIIDSKVTSQGVPYSDTFIVYMRQDYSNSPKGVQILAYIQIQFIKKTMVQGIIEKQARSQMKEIQQNYVKFLNKMVSSDPTVKKKKMRGKPNPDGNLNTDPTNQQKIEQQPLQTSQSLEQKYATLLKSNQELLKTKLMYRNIIIGLLILALMQLIF